MDRSPVANASVAIKVHLPARPVPLHIPTPLDQMSKDSPGELEAKRGQGVWQFLTQFQIISLNFAVKSYVSRARVPDCHV